MSLKSRFLMTQYLIPIRIGSALGTLMGEYGPYNSGTYPLTSTLWRGAIGRGGTARFITSATRP